MPLAPLPEDNTKRYFLVYACGGFEHRLQIRVTDGVVDSAAVTNISSMVNTIVSELTSDWVATGLEVAEKGSNIRNPVGAWLPINGTGSGALAGQFRAQTSSFRGRSATGRKVKFLLFGLTHAPEVDFEWTPTTGTPIEVLINGILNAQTNYFVTIDGTAAVWKQNVLQDYNDHYEQELRP